MNQEYWLAIIGIGGTVIGTLIGTFITIFHDLIREEQKAKKEIRAAINSVLFVTVTNDYVPALNRLRSLIISDAQGLVGNEELTYFYRTWLNHPLVSHGKGIANWPNQEDTKQMISDLMKVRI